MNFLKGWYSIVFRPASIQSNLEEDGEIVVKNGVSQDKQDASDAKNGKKEMTIRFHEISNKFSYPYLIKTKFWTFFYPIRLIPLIPVLSLFTFFLEFEIFDFPPQFKGVSNSSTLTIILCYNFNPFLFWINAPFVKFTINKTNVSRKCFQIRKKPIFWLFSKLFGDFRFVNKK